MTTATFIKAMDAASVNALKQTPRIHLGASQIGTQCPREAWYGFRGHWITAHGGRMERLFNRGHEEEFRVARWLRAMGITVEDYATRLCYDPDIDQYLTIDWDDAVPEKFDDVSTHRHHIERATSWGCGPKQWGFQDGHFSGSCDGRLLGVDAWFPEAIGRGLFECKTSNDRSFAALKAKGVKSGKPVHHAQMQIYMHHMGLKWALYLVVNKNDDNIYVEIIHYKSEIALAYVDRAHKIIEARQPPPKLSSDPSDWRCRFCDFREICHYDHEPHKNCRSCAFASAEPGGEWKCMKFGSVIPRDFLHKGCDKWSVIL